MNRSDIVEILKSSMPHARERFGVEALWIFGSGSRDELGPESDVDVLVRFADRATFRGFFGLQSYLGEQLGGNVDPATENMLKPLLRVQIEGDLVRVA